MDLWMDRQSFNVLNLSSPRACALPTYTKDLGKLILSLSLSPSCPGVLKMGGETSGYGVKLIIRENDGTVCSKRERQD